MKTKMNGKSHSAVKNNNGASRPTQRFAVTKGGNRFILNEETFSRLALMQLSGTLPALDIDGECRYPKELTLNHFQTMYEREGLATRVCCVYPEEAWAMTPDIYETENLTTDTDFELAWKEMDEKFSVLSHLETADETSGIGNFGIVLLGFDDGKALEEPVGGIRNDGTQDARFTKKLNLTYIRTLSQTYASIKEYEEDTANPRYGQPTMYRVQLVQLNTEQLRIPNDSTLSVSTNQPVVITPVDVHWTRVIHVSLNSKGSELISMPMLQNVYNRIYDIKKILGADGQGCWNAGIPALSIETQPNIEDTEIDIESVKKEVQDFVAGLQRTLALEGMEAKMLNFQMGDPNPHIKAHLQIICTTIGTPVQIFLGTEEGKLASNQYVRTWNKKLMRRQNMILTPRLLRPFLERMFLVGALPRPENLFISWPDLNAPTENDRATTAQKVTDALTKYIAGNVFILMQPREYLINIIGLSAAKVEAIIKASNMTKMMKKLDALAKAAMLPPGGGPLNKGKNSLTKKTKKPPANEGAGRPA